MPIDLGCPIVHASCADPYVVLLTEDGQVILLTLREGRGAPRLQAQTPNLMFVSITMRLVFFYLLILINKNELREELLPIKKIATKSKV